MFDLHAVCCTRGVLDVWFAVYMTLCMKDGLFWDVAKFSNDFKQCRILVEMLRRFPDTIPKIGVSCICIQFVQHVLCVPYALCALWNKMYMCCVYHMHCVHYGTRCTCAVCTICTVCTMEQDVHVLCVPYALCTLWNKMYMCCVYHMHCVHYGTRCTCAVCTICTVCTMEQDVHVL